ncbi:XRE family transcriptional regulator [Lentzea sp. NEAU-D7]|uniref:XRE family transcriptional regulator n=1 Tax=Lentzea sp. NEAU-D7 TaxID=2994667 RepID=UPI00224AC4C9|nr:XRE family transcriptional regulator [Lentzea sp. NEAU-D7]MCX2947385.1 helix-turn-helix domain-containing protein [Lentzea sp. NEAU-D7]
MVELGPELRRRRESAGYSLDKMAKLVHFTKGHLSKVETGRTQANRELAAAYDQVLGANGELIAIADAQPARRKPRGLMGLPAHTPHFVGRGPELTALGAVLGERQNIRVAVISGMAGSGKTALAVAAARTAADSFLDGCLLFDLRGHSPGMHPQSPAETAYHLLQSLDTTHDLIPADPDGRVNLLRDTLRNRDVLVVLDNVRHAGQVRPLLPAEGRSRVIITSRWRLPALDDAWHLDIDALSPAEALRLFQSLMHGTTTVDEPDAAAIVAHCGHLPLAIRIAAARILRGGWSARRFLQRLADRSTKLTYLEETERGVSAALAITCDLLPPEQRELLGLMANHPSTTMPVPSVQAVAGLAPGDTDLLLDGLHEAHLVSRSEDEQVRLHDLVHTYAMQHVRPADEVSRLAFDRLTDHYLAAAIAADKLLEPARHRPAIEATLHSEAPFEDAAGALAWMRSQWPTLVRLTDLVTDRRCWQLALAVRGFFFQEKLYDSWIHMHLAALTAAAGDPAATGRVLNGIGMARLEMGQVAESVDCHERALRSFVEAGDKPGAVDASASLAWARMHQDEVPASLEGLTAALAEYRRTGRDRNTVITLRGIAFALTCLDRFDEARAHATEARRSAAAPIDVVRGINCLAWVEYRAGAAARARDLYAEAADLAELADNGYERARALTGLGNLAGRAGDHDGAAVWWAQAAEHYADLVPVVVWEARAREELTRA